MIKVRVTRFLPPADRGWDVSHEALPEAIRDELFAGVEATQNGDDLVIEFQNDDLECSIVLDAIYFDRENALAIGLQRRFGAHVRAEFQWLLPDFRSVDAADVIYASRIKGWRYVGVRWFPAPIPSGVIDRYVAFWQAWSVPVCDDVRRIVFSFLSQVK